MAVFSVTTTAQQDRVIDYLVTKGQAPNATALVQTLTSQGLNELIARARERNADDLGAAYQQADPTVQLQVRTLLNVTGI